jgi:hypothetical protein
MGLTRNQFMALALFLGFWMLMAQWLLCVGVIAPGICDPAYRIMKVPFWLGLLPTSLEIGLTGGATLAIMLALAGNAGVRAYVFGQVVVMCAAIALPLLAERFPDFRNWIFGIGDICIYVATYFYAKRMYTGPVSIDELKRAAA